MPLEQFNLLSEIVKFTKCGAASNIMNVFKKVMEISTTVKKATSHKKAVKSQETDSSQEVTKHLDPWSRIQGEVEKRH